VLEVIEKLKRRLNAATEALDACNREQRMSRGWRPTLLVYRLICADEDATRWSAPYGVMIVIPRAMLCLLC
jgi:hypothetical protein